MENNRLIKKINGLKLRDIDNLNPIAKYQFIEYIDKNGNLNVSFALYYFKNIYYSLTNKEFFRPVKVTMCKKLSDYIKMNNEFIPIQMAEYYKVKHSKEFILETQWYKNILENHNSKENGL